MEFSLGLVEVSSLGNAISMLDAMTKVADVKFVACERKLGGRLVTIVVQGSVSAVTASVDAGKAVANRLNCLKAAEVIARPHREIYKFLHLDEETETVTNSESAATHTGSVPAKAEKPEEVIAEKAAKAPAKKPAPKKTPAKKTAEKPAEKKPAPRTKQTAKPATKKAETPKGADKKTPAKRSTKK